MTRQEILDSLESCPFVEIFEVTREQVVAYNQNAATDFTIRFAEPFTKEDLRALIHVLPDIPAALRPDADALAEYLWEVMDRNAFLTLGGLWYVYSDAQYAQIARFHGYDEAVTLPDHDAKGCMWFARQVCIVDVRRIEQYLARKNPNPDFDPLGYLRRDVVVTTLHELRHVMLDTNPVLPIDDYPLELGTEFMVERYAQDICEDACILHIFEKSA